MKEWNRESRLDLDGSIMQAPFISLGISCAPDVLGIQCNYQQQVNGSPQPMFNDGVNATQFGVYFETNACHCCPVGFPSIFHKYTLGTYPNKVVPDTLHLIYREK